LYELVFAVPLVPAADTMIAANLDLQLGRITYTDTIVTVTAQVFKPITQLHSP
jgi:hypothetical protein